MPRYTPLVKELLKTLHYTEKKISDLSDMF